MRQILNSLQVLEHLALRLAKIPGQKSIIFLSDGFILRA
jgi:hypothetical protein